MAERCDLVRDAPLPGDPSDGANATYNPRQPACARVLLVDPTPVTRLSLACTLGNKSSEFMLESTGKIAGQGERHDLVLLNIKSMPITHSEALKQIAALIQWSPESPIAVISELDDMALAAFALKKELRGYIPTSLSSVVVVAAIELMVAGGLFMPERLIRNWSKQADALQPGEQAAVCRSNDCARLTAREKETLEQIRRGQPNKLIAHELGITESTVKVHVRSVMKKLGASNRTQAALRQTLSPPDEHRIGAL